MGFDDYLSKPIELPKLESLLIKYLPQEKVIVSVKKEADSDNLSQSGDEYPILSEAGIDTAAGLGYCQKDWEFYRSILADFANGAAEKKRCIQLYFDAQNWKDYEIYVHAMKSTSKTIGAKSLSGLAADMEKAAKAGDGDTIKMGYSRLIDEYDRVVDAIRLTFPSADAHSEDDDEILEFMPE